MEVFESDFFKVVLAPLTDEVQGNLAILVKTADGWSIERDPSVNVPVSALKELKEKIAQLKSKAPLILWGHCCTFYSLRLCSFLGFAVQDQEAYLIPNSLTVQNPVDFN